MHVGLIAGGFKPFTSGHYFLVQKASQENDLVHLFVSTKDRTRPGEFPITWDKMKQVWKILKKHMPKNVVVHFSENPTTDQYKILIDAEVDESDSNVYNIYADAKDIKRYDNPRIKERTLPRLYSNDQLIFHSFERASAVNVSGTKVRQALSDGDVEAFTKMMPGPVKQYGPKMFDLLTSSSF